MNQDTRNKLQRATQRVRRILEEEFTEQLEGTFDVLPNGKILPKPGKHLDARQRLTRKNLVDAIDHIKAGGKKPQEAVDEYTREAAFTFLNRFIALRMLEARGMLQECVSKGDASSGFKEFCGLAPGLSSLVDGGYRLYLECLFDELTVEVKVLFDRRDSASLLWPRRGALTELLDVLGQADLVDVWSEDETIGWVYQYFNSGEERKKMREESQAPRNSRELAVRNQFFTPRYVVEFLTDNTLGRIWYEMRKGETRLVDECDYLVRRSGEVFLNEGQETLDESESDPDLSQEKLLKKTVHLPYRAKKDPRDLKILDPACGSGHFLLYAFDLLISIYDEAWHDEAGVKSEISGQSLRDDYPELKQLHAALPGLVLAQNLHGIDIDPRATQIAALALWMRGQRAFNEFQITREQRPAIARSNIVCAEPMPGEAAFLDEFIADHLSDNAESRFLASLVRKVFDAMKLAGEAGSLLKIEEDIAEDVAKAKKQWLERPDYKQQTLFDDGPTIAQKDLDLTLGITDESFWQEAEQRIYDALQSYSDQAEQSGGFQRRLFAADAARGFALVDVSRQSYDVALMNPPFGESTERCFAYLSSKMPNDKRDLLTAFVASAVCRIEKTGGLLGAITKREPLFTRAYIKWREVNLYDRGRIAHFADLGRGVLDDAMVETSAYIIASGRRGPRSVVVSRFNEDRTQITGNGQCINHETLKAIPGAPLAFDAPQHVLDAYLRFERLGHRHARTAQGSSTTDDFRFCRLRQEVPITTIHDYSKTSDFRDEAWVPFVKGEPAVPFFADAPVLLKWTRNGQEVKEYNRMRYGSASRNITNEDLYGVPGIVFPRRTSRFLPRLLPKGCVFSKGGQAVFCREGNPLALLGILASDECDAMLRPQLGRADMDAQYEVGAIGCLPMPDYRSREAALVEATEIAIHYWQFICSHDETSSCFSRLYVASDSVSLTQAVEKWSDTLRSRQVEYTQAVDELNRIAAEVFESSNAVIPTVVSSQSLTESDAAIAVFSIGLGAALSRFTPDSIQHAADSIPSSVLTIPRMSKAIAEYDRVEGSGILVDDVGHEDDLVTNVGAQLRTLWPRFNRDVVTEVGQALAGTDDFRRWVGSQFFSFHQEAYKSNKRKAPIYWQLATPAASYSVWLYYHRFTKDTFFQVLNEYVTPKLDHERQKLERVQSEGGAEPTRSQRKEIEDQGKFVAELASMTEEVERIAPLWNPNLNDGVIINCSPLWRLVPQNKSWQKECKKVWDKLVKGEYDWAHLAMHLWPERVVSKCATDASLAIAHGLEKVFWEQDDRDRFQPKEEPKDSWDPVIKKLVKERTSPAVKASLESLLTAPAPAGNSKSRRRKATT